MAASGVELPEQLVAQFRATSLERLERIEAAWAALTQRMGTADTERELFHDVHTLKGESRLVGFADVGLIAHRLEDLLFAARRRRYRVHEDVEVVVTMAVQFARMLVRKRAGASQGGIDLSGFVKHIDEVLSEWPRQSEGPDSLGPTSTARADGGRVSAAMKQRLGLAATEVYLQSLATPGSRRLRRAWEILAGELAQLDVVALMPLVRRHANATKDLAVELGKEVDIVIEGEDLRVGAEVLDALHTALLHTLRNAVDHGVEAPDVRIARGKPRRGMITIRAESDAESIKLTIEDDGAGLDAAGIKRRAVSLGLLRAEDAANATEAALVELVFAPGFSVRDAVSTTSGRGIGMDAVRATIERIRGTIGMEPRGEGGLRVVLRVPQTCKTMDVHRVPTTRPDVVLAIPTTWTIRRGAEGDAVDPLELLELPGGKGSRTCIAIARDREEHLLWVAEPVTRATALRGCPTSPQEPVEIVTLGDETAILLRPEAFFAPTSGR